MQKLGHLPCRFTLQVEGLVIALARLPPAEYVPFLGRVPIVIAGRREISHGISSVACDDADGGHCMAEHLLQLGHRKIAVLLVDGNYSQRYHAPGLAMIDHIRAAGGTPVVWETPTDLAASDVGRSELGAADVTAIMCPPDSSAMEVLEFLRQLGESTVARFSVTGYDGFGPLAAPYIGLTTFRKPIEEIGRTAIDLLVVRIEERTDQDRFVSLRGIVVTGRTARKPLKSLPACTRRTGIPPRSHPGQMGFARVYKPG